MSGAEREDGAEDGDGDEERAVGEEGEAAGDSLGGGGDACGGVFGAGVLVADAAVTGACVERGPSAEHGFEPGPGGWGAGRRCRPRVEANRRECLRVG